MFLPQPVRFQLNHATAKSSGQQYSDREYSIWVSELTDDVTEKDLRKTFESRYDSLQSVKGEQENLDSLKAGFFPQKQDALCLRTEENIRKLPTVMPTTYY